MYNFFGVEWDINSAVFWIVVAQAIFILIAVILIVVLIVRGVRAKHRAEDRERAALLARRNDSGNVTYRGGNGANAPYQLTHVVTTPDFADHVEKYVEDVLEKSRKATDAAGRMPTGPVYYTDITPGVTDPYAHPREQRAAKRQR